MPKEELLRKLLKMTTSDNDNTALVAIRKANQLMTASGWDWDKLLNGKIKVVANPFASVAVPTSEKRGGTPTAPYARPAPQPKRTIGGGKANQYEGYCWCCGYHVAPMAGYIFKPRDYNNAATDRWQVVCDPCNTNPHYTVPATRAKPRAPKGSVDNLI